MSSGGGILASTRRERRFAKAISSLDQVFALLKEFVDAEGLGPDVEFRLNVATEEIFTNFVKYNVGPGSEILIAVERRAHEAVVELTDFDVEPFSLEDAPPVDVHAPLEQRRPGGLGLHLVKSLVDKVSFEYRHRALKVSLRKRLD
ncbi:MAG TPA: ATP-binding protein [Acidobacteriota bacterium]